MTANLFLGVPLLGLLGAACMSDLKSRRIPNALTLGGALVALLLQAYTGGLSGLAVGFTGWLVGLGCFLLFYAVGALAAGDVKLMAMAGAFLGPVPAVAASLSALLLGAALGGLLLALQLFGRASDPESSKQSVGASPTAESKADRLAQVPYGIAIALGAALVLVWPQVIELIIPMEVSA